MNHKVFLLGLVVFIVLQTKAIALSRDEINERISSAIERTQKDSVVIEDILGEGPGQWDSDPRYPGTTVNCMVWIQQIIAEVYGLDPQSKQAVMDRIRYYGGLPAFGMRKHFTDHWLAVEPAPFVRYDMSGCGSTVDHRVDLDFSKFKKAAGYSCTLFEEHRNRFNIRFENPKTIEKCLKREGYYFLFAAPTEKYLSRFASKTGPMGLVHAMIYKRAPQSTVYHASFLAKKIMIEKAEDFFRKTKGIYKGFVVFELDPNWQPEIKSELVTTFESSIKKIIECEHRLPIGGRAH